MKTVINLLVVTILLIFQLMVCQAKVGYNIKVHPNKYEGGVILSGSKNMIYLKDTIITLCPDTNGMYYFNTGASIGDNTLNNPTSYIYLTFNQDSTIKSILPDGTGKIVDNGKGIEFNTAPVTIDPGNSYDRAWHPTFGVNKLYKNKLVKRLYSKTQNFYTNKQTISLIKCLTYAINNADSYLLGIQEANDTLEYNSYFYFTVDCSGQLQVYGRNKISARVENSILKFNLINVTIDPDEISGGITPLIIPGADGTKTKQITKKEIVPFIRGTVNYLTYMNGNKQMYFHFIPM